MSDPVATETAPTEGRPAGTPPNGIHPITVEVMVRLQAVAIPEPGGGYSIAVPALPGCYSAAETIEEVQGNVVEAAEGWLGAQHDRAKDETVRVMTT
jgi:predicted RNase H-like HicB family nuclease